MFALTSHAAPASLLAGATLDLATVAASIESQRAALKEALETVAREERELQKTMSDRDNANARWTRTYSGVATLAGLDDLASKVRPTERRRAGIAEEEV